MSVRGAGGFLHLICAEVSTKMVTRTLGWSLRHARVHLSFVKM